MSLGAGGPCRARTSTTAQAPSSPATITTGRGRRRVTVRLDPGPAAHRRCSRPHSRRHRSALASPAGASRPPRIRPVGRRKIAPVRDDSAGRQLPRFRAMESTIEVSGLHKRFGSTTALDGMTFTVRPGVITGFVGPNGAGKSTTMRVILGLDAADAGTALIGGQPYRQLRQPLRHVGALLDASRAATRADRAEPPAVAGALAGSGCRPGRRGARAVRAASRRPGGRPAATRSGCGSGSGSPPRCWVIRRC